MLETCNDLAVEILVGAIEQMAFISPFPAEAPPPPPQNALLLHIQFTGAARKRIDLLADESLGAMMVSNILGIDPADPDARFRAADALKELLNVTCGALLRQWMAAEPGAYEMSIPQAGSIDAPRWQELLGQGDFTLLDAEGMALAIRIVNME